MNNATESNGGGLAVSGSDTAEPTNCTISGNRADGDGGGADVNFGHLVLRSCTVTDNSADFNDDGERAGGGL